MTEVVNKDQQEEVLEGEVETPNTRKREFKSSGELGKWIETTKPKALQVNTVNTSSGLVYVLITQEL